MISAQCSSGVIIQNLQIQYTNSSFSGRVIDASKGSSCAAGNSANTTVQNNSITGTSGRVANASAGVYLDGNVTSTVQNNVFNNMKTAVYGINPSGADFSNAIHVNGNVFGNESAGFPNGMIVNPGNAWEVCGNTFEIGTSSVYNVIDGSAITSGTLNFGSLFCANWFGDSSSGWSGVIFNKIGSGFTISGNEITGQASSSGSMLATSANTTFFSFNGNDVQGFRTIFNFGGSTYPLIFGNSYESNNTFLAGTAPAGGFIQNPTGTNLIYGNTSIYAGGYISMANT